MKFIVDKLSSLLTYLKGFFNKQQPLLQNDIESQLNHITVLTPKNPMDDIPECNFKAERDAYAFRI